MTTLPRVITPCEIEAAVCMAFGVQTDVFRSKQRNARLSRCREAYAMLCRELTYHSFPEIARQCGRAHSSIITHNLNGQDRLEREPDFVARVNATRELLGVAT